MRTPAGVECDYFFGDYYRGRDREECRLLASANPPQKWRPELCQTCPVPEILNANACPNLILDPEVIRSLPLLKRQVKINSRCFKTNQPVSEPKIGCGECHPLPEFFIGEPRGDNPAT